MSSQLPPAGGGKAPLPPASASAGSEPEAPITLRDLLGTLARDVTAARADADAESMRIARVYRGDPLLRMLPVPLFRLSDVNISMPLAIVAVPGEQETSSVPLTAATSIVLALVLDALAEHGGDTSAPATADIARALETARRVCEGEPRSSRDAVAVADALLTAALGALTEVQRALLKADEEQPGSFAWELRLAARARILALQQAAGVQIDATTAAIEAVSPRDSLVQLRVTLSERGMEWALGEHSERLVPE